jgi:hypothetical protein
MSDPPISMDITTPTKKNNTFMEKIPEIEDIKKRKKAQLEQEMNDIENL